MVVWMSPEDDLDEVMNSLSNVNNDLDDLENELLNFNYTLIQIGTIPPDFSVNMVFTLPSIFKASPRQPNSFDDDFEEEAIPCGPLIAEAESLEPERDVDAEASVESLQLKHRHLRPSEVLMAEGPYTK